MTNVTLVLDRRRVIDALKRAIAETLQRSGRILPEVDDYTLCPILDIEGFDSLCGIEVTVDLETSLGIADLTHNVFIKIVGKHAKARTFDEVVDAILNCAGAGQ